jgi:hypothetical protein
MEELMAANQLHVKHVQVYLDEKLGPEVDTNDVRGRLAPEQSTIIRRTRALAALAVQIYTGCDEAEAARHVIDGVDDNGIDAIAWDMESSRLYLIQSKWSDSGKAQINLNDALKFKNGLELLLNHQHERFNSRYQDMAQTVAALLDNPRLKVTLASVTMGTSQINFADVRPINETLDALNIFNQCAEFQSLGLPEVYRFIRNGSEYRPISLEVRLDGPGQIDQPHLAYYGTVPVTEVAEWYRQHGPRLFDQNIRTSIGSTRVSAKIGKTLTEDSSNFWYFNNGITIVCGRILRTGIGRLRINGPLNLFLEDVSIVNGAQTVAAIHSITNSNPEAAAAAQIMVRIIQSHDEEFAKQITENVNTQHAVNRRDAAALDPIQHRIRLEFESLGLHYAIRRGELKPASESGSDVSEAAAALAAAYPDVNVVVDSYRDEELLWSTDKNGHYHKLFHGDLNGLEIWKKVQVHRTILDQISRREASSTGREAAFIKRLPHVISHTVLQYLADELTNGEDSRSWNEELSIASVSATNAAIGFMISDADRMYGRYFPSAIAGNYERCAALAQHTIDFLRNGSSGKQVPTAEQFEVIPRRKLNSVNVINRYQAISEGERIEFRARTSIERERMGDWLREDPARRFATWLLAPQKVLKWQYDNEAYSPSGLVAKIWEQATGERPRHAILGARYWYVAERGSLMEIAESLREGTSHVPESLTDE